MIQPQQNRFLRRAVAEWALTSERPYAEPFADVDVTGTFYGPSGQKVSMPAFYDGHNTWRLRFNPAEAGEWRLEISSQPCDLGLAEEVAFTVEPNESRGFAKATPGEAWGWHYESGEPIFYLGDTVYNLFGMAHCGADVEGFLERRAAQGFNLFRVRVPVSPFHPPEGYSYWQTRRTWPWGGSEQKPVFSRFNLDYFATVDRVIQKAEALGLGLEVIMEAWGFEFPFNRRDLFVPEWEELWLRYLIARYDAYNCVHIWTLMNEYEFYPDGDWRYNPVADRWAIRMARWVKANAPHGHAVAVHNGPRLPPFAERFARDPGAIDAIMFQEWGTRDAENGWLAAGIEEVIGQALAGWKGSAVFAEWGYERNPEFPPNIPSHIYCDRHHTRRGAWRGAFCGLGIIHGFENSWGPFLKLDEDQPGLADLLTLKRFFTQVVPFARLRPAPELLASEGPFVAGHKPLILASAERDLIAAYLPTGGEVRLSLPLGRAYWATWFDPVSGEERPALGQGGHYAAPAEVWEEHPKDWVLLLRAG